MPPEPEKSKPTRLLPHLDPLARLHHSRGMSTEPTKPKSITAYEDRIEALEKRVKANRAKIAAYTIWQRWHGKTGARYRYCSLFARASAPEDMLKAINLTRLTDAEQAELAELGTTFLNNPWTVEVPVVTKRKRRSKTGAKPEATSTASVPEPKAP